MKIRLVFLTVASFAVLACTASSVAAQQSQERIIRRLPVEKDEPIEITDVKVNGQSVSLDKKFNADDDWLKSLEISIKNRSNKPIVFASLRFLFPRPASQQEPPSIHDMYWGKWGLQVHPPKPDEQLKFVDPGEKIDISFSPQQFTDLRNFLSATHYAYNVQQIDLSIGHVIFSDDTGWYAGTTMVRKPNDPTTWVNARYVNP